MKLLRFGSTPRLRRAVCIAGMRFMFAFIAFNILDLDGSNPELLTKCFDRLAIIEGAIGASPRLDPLPKREHLKNARVLTPTDPPDQAPNYLLTTRIVNRCNPTENPQGPQVPAPLVANAGCPSVHPNANWSVDISWFDPVFEKAYIADRDNKALDIVDTRSDTVVGQATGFVGVVAGTNTSGPNGVVTTHNPNQLWGGDGNGDTRIYSLDAKGLNSTLIKVVLATDPKLNVTRRADELAYDPDHQLVLMAWDDAADLLMAFITVNSNPTVVGTISLKTNCPALSGCSTGGIEQPAYDRRIGRFLVSVP